MIPHRTTCLTLAALPSHFRLYLTLPLPSCCLSLPTLSFILSLCFTSLSLSSHCLASHTVSRLAKPLALALSLPSFCPSPHAAFPLTIYLLPRFRFYLHTSLYRFTLRPHTLITTAPTTVSIPPQTPLSLSLYLHTSGNPPHTGLPSPPILSPHTDSCLRPPSLSMSVVICLCLSHSFCDLNPSVSFRPNVSSFPFVLACVFVFVCVGVLVIVCLIVWLCVCLSE